MASSRHAVSTLETRFILKQNIWSRQDGSTLNGYTYVNNRHFDESKIARNLFNQMDKMSH